MLYGRVLPGRQRRGRSLAPDWVREIHLAYIQAGAEVIQTNTFAGNSLRLAEAGLDGRVRDVNFRAVKLAREAREMSGQAIWIAGSVGPLGRRARRHGAIVAEMAGEAFREQIAVLWEAGADLLVLETFSDLTELGAAVQAARQTTDLPVIAEMTYGNDGIAEDGSTPADAARILSGLGWTWPASTARWAARVLDFITEMHRAEPSLRLSAMPNAGLPYRAGDRMVYPSAPHYFARHVAPMIDAGVAVVGGCCGTTPAHTRAMRSALDEMLRRTHAAPQIGREELAALPMVRVSALGLPEAVEMPEPLGAPEAQRRQVRRQRQVDPPRGSARRRCWRGRVAQGRGRADASTWPTAHGAVRMGRLARLLIQQQVGIETIFALHARSFSHGHPGRPDRGARARRAQHHRAHWRSAQPRRPARKHRRVRSGLGSPGEAHQPVQRRPGPLGQALRQPVGLHDHRRVDPTRDGLARGGSPSQGERAARRRYCIYDPARRRFFALYEDARPFPVPVPIGILPLHAIATPLPAQRSTRHPIPERIGTHGVRSRGRRLASSWRRTAGGAMEMPWSGVIDAQLLGVLVACEVLDVLKTGRHRSARA
jgi:homocysteine S-methyltransferase